MQELTISLFQKFLNLINYHKGNKQTAAFRFLSNRNKTGPKLNTPTYDSRKSETFVIIFGMSD